MPYLQIVTRVRVILFLTPLLVGSCAYGQTGSLSLASGSIPSGATISLNLSLSASIAPAAVQWAFSYSASDVTSISVAAGPALTAAGKSLSCNTANGSTICLASGLNANTIANGVVAVVNITLAVTSSGSVPIAIGSTYAALPDGTAASISGTGGTITVSSSAIITPTSVSCSPTALVTPGTATCTLTLSAPAPSGGLTVSLSDNSAFVSVPASVTVPSGSATASFTASAASVSSTQTATITGSLGGGSAAGSLTLYAAGTMPDAAVSYAFDEGSGATVTDASGNGNTGQIQGATWTAAGKFGNALSFNGTSSYVDLGNPASLQTTGSMTWSAWVYATGNPPDDGVIAASSWELKTTPDTGARTFSISFWPGGPSTLRYSTTVVALNTWYHVAGVYNAAAQTLDIYVNGVLDNGVLTGTVPSSHVLPSVNTTIGKRLAGSAGYYFNGVIDNLRVYTRALSAAEIQQDMTTPVGTASHACRVFGAVLSVHHCFRLQFHLHGKPLAGRARGRCLGRTIQQ